MKITGQAQFTKETNQEKFYNGSTGFQAGEFTVKVKNIEFNDRENRYFTIVFENNGAQQQTSMSQQSNPFESSGQFGYDDQDLAF
ncbi:hypothetical protein [Staphylococcus aureus]|uniref:hypothetical protein n=1 Tax=Staphylococcus aureus TaxID=1280 RepID=UPI000DAAC197|nr:hypothetical protein [Staphylococcus aureus]PZH14800.1 hypothetical protein C7R07_14475 [Staphylococcus aureus]